MYPSNAFQFLPNFQGAAIVAQSNPAQPFLTALQGLQNNDFTQQKLNAEQQNADTNTGALNLNTDKFTMERPWLQSRNEFADSLNQATVDKDNASANQANSQSGYLNAETINVPLKLKEDVRHNQATEGISQQQASTSALGVNQQGQQIAQNIKQSNFGMINGYNPDLQQATIFNLLGKGNLSNFKAQPKDNLFQTGGN